MLHLSKRLSVSASLVPEDAVLADVGTDHAFLPIFLCETGQIDRAVAMDVAEGPLSRAREHIKEAGLRSKIEVRLSDGLTALKPSEADTVSLLGMGGSLIMRILSDHDPRGLHIRTLLLGPQSEVPVLREFLLREGYRIETERLVEEEGKFYFLLLVRTDSREERAYSAAEILYGRTLLSQKDPVLLTFLERRKKTLEEIRKNLAASRSDVAKDRLAQLQAEQEIIKEIEYGQ